MIGRDIRRYLVCLGLALAFALLPTVLVHHNGSASCDSVLAEGSQDGALPTANPFSHYNLCKIRQRLTNLTHDVYQHAGGARINLLQSLNASDDAAPAPAPAPPSAAQRPLAPPTSPPPPRVASSPPPRVASSPPPAASLAVAPSPSPPPAGSPPNDAGADTFPAYRIEDLISTEISAPSIDMRGKGGVEDWSDFVLPQTQEDVDRLMQVPHIDECFYCKVCIPSSALRLDPAAAARRGGARTLHASDDAADYSPVYGIDPLPGDGDDESVSNAESDDDISSSDGAARHSAVGAAEEAAPVGGLGSLAGAFARLRAWLSTTLGAAGDGAADAEATRQGAGHSSVRANQRKQPQGQRWQWRRRIQQAAGTGAANATAGKRNGTTARAPSPKARGKPPPAYQARDETESDGLLTINGRTFNISDIAPGDTIFKQKAKKPNCTICRGCDHTLELMASGSVLLDSYYAHEPGGSPSWLLRVRTDKTASGWAVVKVWCVPVLKAKQRGLAMCAPRKVYAQVKLLLAQQKLTAECGLNVIVPKVWVEPVNGVIPGKGFHVKWLGLWADIADGVSVQNIQEFGKPPMPGATVIELFRNRVNHDEIRLAAIFDLLFSQCDRHQQNVFLTAEGKVWLIDNDQVFTTAWRRCGIDSMLVPTTQKFMINHLGFFYVLKYPHADPPVNPSWIVNPLALLDYRCHVQGGAIGKQFPPQLVSCLKRIRAKTPEEIHFEYGYPNLRMASAVRNRSSDLLAHGYEWTLLWGEPTNQAMHRYKIAPKCCDMTFNATSRKYNCTTPGFYFMREVPYGNAWHGGPWHGTPGKDTGTYIGGSAFRALGPLGPVVKPNTTTTRKP